MGFYFRLPKFIIQYEQYSFRVLLRLQFILLINLPRKNMTFYISSHFIYQHFSRENMDVFNFHNCETNNCCSQKDLRKLVVLLSSTLPKNWFPNILLSPIVNANTHLRYDWVHGHRKSKLRLTSRKEFKNYHDTPINSVRILIEMDEKTRSILMLFRSCL